MAPSAWTAATCSGAQKTKLADSASPTSWTTSSQGEPETRADREPAVPGPLRHAARRRHRVGLERIGCERTDRNAQRGPERPALAERERRAGLDRQDDG